MIPQEAYEHCLEHGRNSELEKIILADPRCAYKYSLHVIKDRWKEAEKTIATNPAYAYYYAQYVIKGRWLEAENIISTNSQLAYRYALDIIRGKLPENMHNMMLLHADEYAKKYLDFINKLKPSV